MKIRPPIARALGPVALAWVCSAAACAPAAFRAPDFVDGKPMKFREVVAEPDWSGIVVSVSGYYHRGAPPRTTGGIANLTCIWESNEAFRDATDATTLDEKRVCLKLPGALSLDEADRFAGTRVIVTGTLIPRRRDDYVVPAFIDPVYEITPD